MSDFVSIIIPIRNEEKFISECLDSVIAQTYPKKSMEVLLVDGRSDDKTKEIIHNQINNTFKDLTKGDLIKTVIAYEPIWAIGTGRTATPEQAEEIHLFIREILELKYDSETSNSIRIQYGGSIKPNNAKELFEKDNIDGGLVGGASLQADSLLQIIKAADATTK